MIIRYRKQFSLTLCMCIAVWSLLGMLNDSRPTEEARIGHVEMMDEQKAEAGKKESAPTYITTHKQKQWLHTAENAEAKVQRISYKSTSKLPSRSSVVKRQAETKPTAVSIEAKPNSVQKHEEDIQQEMKSLPNDLKKALKVSVMATGYTAGIESTGKTSGHPLYGITFSGVKVRRDLVSTIAADTSIFPIGSLLYIPEYGYGVVADTGSAIKGNKLDLFFNSTDDVFTHWGKRQVEVYVLARGQGKLTEADVSHYNDAASTSNLRVTLTEAK